ncbi:MAG: hypothetical protein QNI95_06980 [Desulfobacterales bacterium]|nr:hypothetical protein [Desulfobacterales bacterium]
MKEEMGFHEAMFTKQMTGDIHLPDQLATASAISITMLIGKIS